LRWASLSTSAASRHATRSGPDNMPPAHDQTAADIHERFHAVADMMAL